MLSDIGTSSHKYSVSLSYSNNKSGRSKYNSVSLGLGYRPFDWLQLSGSIPYMDVSGKDVFWELDQTELVRREFEYSNSGLGDVMIMAWANALYPFLDHSDTKTDPADDEEELIDDPAIYIGLGVKLPTGSHDEDDPTKLKFDQSKSKITGQFSEADGIIPNRFQLGSGTTDILVGIFYMQRFGDFTPSAGVSYQFTGGDNDIGYEKSDRVSWTLGTKYMLYKTIDCRQLYLSGGLSGVTNTSRDFDHSENTSLIDYQPIGRVPGTDGTYNFYSLGMGYEVTRNLTINGSVTLPLSKANERSDNSFDRSISVGVQFKF